MAGRKPVNQTAEPRTGLVTAVQGQDGRLAAAPEGDMYVRDPRAARAKAIRERVALHVEQGIPVPKHLQALFDELPPEDGTVKNEDVELITEAGEHVAEVDLDEGEPQPSGTYAAQGAPKHRVAVEPAVEPEPVVESESDSEAISQETIAEGAAGCGTGSVEDSDASPRPKRGAPRKKV